MEWCRVNRHPLIFRRLTVVNETPENRASHNKEILLLKSGSKKEKENANTQTLMLEHKHEK